MELTNEVGNHLAILARILITTNVIQLTCKMETDFGNRSFNNEAAVSCAATGPIEAISCRSRIGK